MFFFEMSMSLRGDYLGDYTPNQNCTYFLPFLKIINTFSINDISMHPGANYLHEKLKNGIKIKV